MRTFGGGQLSRMAMILFFLGVLCVAPAVADEACLSGRITGGDGSGLPGVTILISGVGEVLTNADGSFTTPALPGNRAYTLVPCLAGYTFIPAERTVWFSSAAAASTFVAAPAATATATAVFSPAGAIKLDRFTTVAGQSNAPASAVMCTWVDMEYLTLTVSSGTGTFDKLIVRNVGTAVAGKNDLRLYRDANANGIWDAEDSWLDANEPAFDSTAKQWTLKPYTTLSTGINRFLLIFFPQSTGTVQLTIASAAALIGGPTFTGTFPITSGATQVTAPVLTVTGTSQAPASAGTAGRRVMEQLTLSAAGPCRLQGLRVRNLGTAEGTASDLSLVRDSNSNGQLDPGESGVYCTRTYEAATKTWSLDSLGIFVPSGQSYTYLLCHEFKAFKAVTPWTVQLQIREASWCVVSEPAAVAGLFPIISGVTTVTAPTASVSGESLAPASTPRTTVTPMERLTVSSDANAHLTGLQVRNLGTAPACEDDLKLYLDNDNDGAVTDGDRKLSGTSGCDRGAKAYTLEFKLEMTAGTEYKLLLCYTAGQASQQYPHQVLGTVQLQILAASWFSFAPATEVTGVFPITSGITQIIQPILSVTGTSLAPASVGAGTTLTMERLTLTAPGPAVVLTGLKVKNLGTAEGSSSTLRLALQRTSTAGDVEEKELDEYPIYDTAARIWMFSNMAVTVRHGEAVCLLLRYTASAAGTVRLSVAAADVALEPYPAAAVVGSFPIRSALMTVYPPVLQVTGTSLAPSSGVTGKQYAIEQLDFAATYQRIFLTKLEVVCVGSPPHTPGALSLAKQAVVSSDIGSADKWIEYSPEYDSTTHTWTYDMRIAVIPGETTRLLLRYWTGPPGTVQLQIPLGGIEFTSAAPATLSGALPIMSDAMAVQGPVLQIAATPMAPARGFIDGEYVMERLALTAQNCDCVLNSLRVRALGTAPTTANAESDLQLYKDTNGNSRIDEIDERLSLGRTYDDATRTWRFNLSLNVPLGRVVTLLIMYRTRTVGTTWLRIERDWMTVGGYGMVTGAFPIVSGAVFVEAPILQVSGASQAPARGNNLQEICMEKVVFRATKGPVTLTAVTVQGIGTGVPQGTQLSLHKDVDRNGVFDRDVDKEIASDWDGCDASQVWRLSFDYPTVTLQPGERMGVFLVTDVWPGTAQLQIKSAAAVEVAAPATVTGTFPITSGTTIIATPTLKVAGISRAPSRSTITQSTLMERLTFSATNGRVFVGQLLVRKNGTANGTPCALSIYQDSDSEGIRGAFDGADWLVNDPVEIGAGGVFTCPVFLEVWPSDPTNIFLVIDHGGNPGTISLQIASKQAILCSPCTISGSFPITSGTTTFSNP